MDVKPQPLWPDNELLNDYNTYAHTIEGVDVYSSSDGCDYWVFLVWGNRDAETFALHDDGSKYDWDDTPSEAAKEYARGILALIQ